jgi:hypothetical protein
MSGSTAHPIDHTAAMARQPTHTKPKRLVWRMTERAPMGEWVDPNAPPERPKKDLPEGSPGNWVGSSYDLLNGVDIDDNPNTVPDDLFDELFPKPDDHKNSGR